MSSLLNVRMVACYHGGPGFKSWQGRELLILNKKGVIVSNLNRDMVYSIHAHCLVQVEHMQPY